MRVSDAVRASKLRQRSCAHACVLCSRLSDDDDDEGTKGDLGSKATHDSKRSGGSKRSPKLFNSKYFVRVGGNTPVPGSMAPPPPPSPAGAAPPPSKLVRVCHYAFLSIHGIGKKRVNNLVSHAFANKDALAAAPRHDLRGRHSNRANRVAEDLVLLAEHHVKSFPRYGIIDGTDAWRQKRLQQRARRDLARRRAEAAGNVINPHPRIQSAKDSDAELPPVESLFGEAAEGIFSSAASVGGSSAKGSYPPLSVGMLLQRAPPRYLSPHLSLVKMYRLFIAHFQPLLLEVEKAAPRLTKLDRKGATAARSSLGTTAFAKPADELISPPASSSSPSTLMPPPPAVRVGASPAQRPGSIQVPSGASASEEAQSAAAAESSPHAGTGSVGSSSAGGAVVVSAFSTISSSQLASVFEQMQCSQCSQQPAIIPVMWKQTSVTPAAVKPAPAIPRTPTSLSKGSKRRRTGEPTTPSGTDTPATPHSMDDDNESIATSGAGGKKGARATVIAGGNASSLLGLFCSPACIQSFVTRFSCIVPQPLSSLVIPTPVDANPASAAANASRLVVPYASWRDMPNLAQADKLLKPLVSRDKYERLFRALNLRFGSGRNFDSCPTCNECALRMEAGEALSGLSRLSVQEAWNQHLIRAKKSADMVDFDRRMSIKSWQHFHAHHGAQAAAANSTLHAHFAMGTVDTIEVGFQANRPLPQYASSSANNLLDSSAYKRQLWVYLYGIHHVASSQTHAFLWDEKTGKRKVNEVISCLWRHIQITAPQHDSGAIKADLNAPPARRAPWLIILGEGFRNFWSLCFLNELCRDDGSMQADGHARQAAAGAGSFDPDSFAAPAAAAAGFSFASASLFSYRRLDYKILEGGHSCMESDKILACVERDSKSTPIFKPSDWSEHSGYPERSAERPTVVC